jgi:hypothetical protein
MLRRPRQGGSHLVLGALPADRPWPVARAPAELVQFYRASTPVKTYPFQAEDRRPDWAELPEHPIRIFMRNPHRCPSLAAIVGPAREVIGGGRYLDRCSRSAPQVHFVLPRP